MATLEVLRKSGPGTMVIVVWTIVALIGSTLFALVSVLCYAYSKRWAKLDAQAEEPAIKTDLLRKAFRLDITSWYVLMIGLIYSIAIASPIGSMLANFAYSCVLFYFYFD